MEEKKYVFPMWDAKEKATHGGAAICRILIDEESCGAKNFSFLVNTMKAGLNCNVTGLGHKHDEEHCLYGLSGIGGISIDGKEYKIEPNVCVFVPAGAMHYVWADPSGDFTYIVIYSPPGPEKEL
ncbi:MAG: cupin domain-containing protein [Deltaproteobacteria bacterium]|nr:cupin domain-containing protein [Deltaproteobacteria bacterium]